MKHRTSKTILGWSSFDYLVLIASLGVILITRWLYHAKYLFHWDSVQFALGVQGIDILHHRPHPPGYLFYVWLGKLANFFTRDEYLALIIVGIFATMVGAILIYLFVRQLIRVSRIPAILAVLFFIFNTSVWFHGLVAEVYIVESVVALTVIWLVYRYWQMPTQINLIWMMVFFGLLGGFRQTTELALVPLLIYVLWQTKANRQRWLLSGGILLITNLIWLIPILINTGGLGAYLNSLATLSDVVIGQYYRSRGFFGQAMTNLNLVGEALTAAVGVELGILLLASAPYLIAGSGETKQLNWHKVWFWLLAIGGPVLLTVCLLMTNPGYVLLPIILIGCLAGIGIWYLGLVLMSASLSLSRLIAGGLAGLVLAMQLWHFYALEPEQFAFINPSLPSITRHAELLSAITQTIRNNSQNITSAVWINTANTIIFFGFRHMQYYLPDLDIYRGLPQSLVHPKDKQVWHAKGPKFEVYEDKIYIADNVQKLFTIRDTWDALHKQYQIPVAMPTGHTLVYYDLTDPKTRQYLSENYNFVFLKNANT